MNEFWYKTPSIMEREFMAYVACRTYAACIPPSFGLPMTICNNERDREPEREKGITIQCSDLNAIRLIGPVYRLLRGDRFDILAEFGEHCFHFTVDSVKGGGSFAARLPRLSPTVDSEQTVFRAASPVRECHVWGRSVVAVNVRTGVVVNRPSNQAWWMEMTNFSYNTDW